MSASTSCRELLAELLAKVRSGVLPPEETVRELGETCAGEFFRDVVEPLADSFDPMQAAAYERLMGAWVPRAEPAAPVIPPQVDIVYVLSRVTLGADIKIVSPILATMKKRFPGSQIVFVAHRKSAELFASDARVEHLNAEYPRTGPVSARVDFARGLRERLAGDHRIVVDPDSRMTQLGLIPVCEPVCCFHFPSRVIGGDTAGNLSTLVGAWLRTTFGAEEAAYIAPCVEPMEPMTVAGRRAAVSLGVGDNESKRVGGDFEARLIGLLGAHFRTVWVDRGAGGSEALRVTAAVEHSGAAGRVRFWEGGFAGFASIVAQSDFYAGYDSAGQHAAAAAGVPLVSIFAGAPSERFRARWTAAGPTPTIPHAIQIVADRMTPDAVLREIDKWIPMATRFG